MNVQVVAYHSNFSELYSAKSKIINLRENNLDIHAKLLEATIVMDTDDVVFISLAAFLVSGNKVYMILQIYGQRQHKKKTVEMLKNINHKWFQIER